MGYFKILFLGGVIFFCLPLFSQTTASPQQRVFGTHKDYLLQLSNKLTIKQKSTRDSIESKALALGLPLGFEMPEGGLALLTGFDYNNHPIYTATTNVSAAVSTRTNTLQPGGTSGYQLDGSGIEIGEWDGGNVLSTHQQFAGRVTNQNSSTVLGHATHVCGTLAGDGTGNAAAKGMAPAATVKVYDYTNDEAEMAAEAAIGMILSNHSYGTIAGWTQIGTGNYAWFGDPVVNSSESYLFGWYNDQAAQWDDIAYNAPYYLIVKSAGNDRGENAPSGASYTLWGSGTVYTNSSSNARPADGAPSGYDCISTYGVAKNILTVGNVYDVPAYNSKGSVTVYPSSGFGPTDDGRIKPDVVGNGYAVLSSYSGSNTDYASLSGTSMSTPSITGTCALLQQLYHRIHSGQYMLSSTIKGLLIHTADECGSYEGPDYIFGWGLVNALAAANAIQNDSVFQWGITEATLNNSDTFLLTIAANGLQPLVATICWTDTAGNAIPISHDNATPNLVNDLDIRLLHNGIQYMPYVLDPTNPANAATKGDNTRDNVEKIYLPQPDTNGIYTIRVSHKGTLGSAQNFSLLISGAGNINCTNPTAFSIRQITTSSATAEWHSNNVGGIYHLSINGISATGTITQANMQVPISGLTDGQKYTVTLWEECSLGAGHSETTGPFDFFTACATLPAGESVAFQEAFESFPPSGWAIENPDGSYTWAGFTPPGCPKGQSAVIANYNYNAKGQTDNLKSPFIDLQGYATASLSFDLAYAPYNPVNYETLKVSVINCDESLELPMYEKREANLGTTGAYQPSPFAPLTCGLWRTETVDLSRFAGQLIKLKFTNTNGFGNYIYLDNVTVNGTIETPLPVTWVNFSATKTASGNKLNWSTAIELNNNYFEIERSPDAKQFEKIGEVMGMGNSVTQQNYSYVDGQPYAGVNYYRLRQVDFDGAADYSKIISISSNPPTAFQLKTTDYSIEVSNLNGADVQVYLLSITGQVISQGNPTSGSWSFNTTEIPAGVYVIQILTPSGATCKRITKR